MHERWTDPSIAGAAANPFVTLLVALLLGALLVVFVG
jgi:hypothetical protein